MGQSSEGCALIRRLPFVVYTSGIVETNQLQDDARTWDESAPLVRLTPETVREIWSKTYNREGKPDWSHILPYYKESMVFQDTIQRIEGKKEFTKMCRRLTDRCEQLNMDILSVSANETEIFFDWKMQMIFRKTPSTPVFGCTRLTIDEEGRIARQRDYYDLWGDIFNGIPGWRRIYRRFVKRLFG